MGNMRTAFAMIVVGLSVGTVSVRAQVADAGPDQYICGDTTYLQSNAPGVGQTGTWSTFSGTAAFTDATLATTQVTGLNFGGNELVWTLTDGFTTTTDTVLITAYNPAAPPAWTMGDTAITGPPFTTTLTASSPYYPQFCFWTIVSGSGMISDMTYSNATVTNLGIGTNVFFWNCNNGPCGVTIAKLLIGVNVFSTGVLESEVVSSPFHFDADSGSLYVLSSQPVSEQRIMDMQGRLVQGNAINGGIYFVSARIGGEVFTQRFAVAR